MILYLLNFCKGVLKISVQGSYIERFFNVCAKYNIAIWNIKRVNIDEMQVDILISDYKKLKALVFETKCNIYVIKKSGIPFILSKIKTRYALILGFVLCFYTYHILTSHLFSIDIIGTDKTTLVYKALEENGIKIGVKLNDINITETKNDIILNYEEFLWLSINIKGNMAVVNVYEREPTPEIIDKYTPCDIIADKTGLIESIEVLSGEKMIEAGHTFLEGDILVSSEVLNFPQVLDLNQRYVHAIANIKASIWYNVTRVMSQKIEVKNYTGNEITEYTLIFDKKAINLFKNTRNSYTFYDKIEYTQKISLSQSVTIPVYLKVEKYLEYEPETYNISNEIGYALLEENLLNNLLEQIDGDIVKTRRNILEFEDLLSIKLNIQTLENIGIEKER